MNKEAPELMVHLPVELRQCQVARAVAGCPSEVPRSWVSFIRQLGWEEVFLKAFSLFASLLSEVFVIGVARAVFNIPFCFLSICLL